MPVQTEQPTYQTCAVMGGAQLANGNLMNLGRAQFTFKPPNCSYSSEPPHRTDLLTVPDTHVVLCPVWVIPSEPHTLCLRAPLLQGGFRSQGLASAHCIRVWSTL